MSWNAEEQTVTTVVEKTATHADMKESYVAKEDVFDGFLGGVQVDSSKIQQEKFIKKVLTNPLTEDNVEDYEPIYEEVEVLGNHYYELETGTSTSS